MGYNGLDYILDYIVDRTIMILYTYDFNYNCIFKMQGI